MYSIHIFFYILGVFVEWKALQVLISTKPNGISNGISSSPPLPTGRCSSTAKINAKTIRTLDVEINVDIANMAAPFGPPLLVYSSIPPRGS